MVETVYRAVGAVGHAQRRPARRVDVGVGSVDQLELLDEATSDLDSRLESKVHRALEEMDRDHTIFGIAHRLSTVKNADTIYTIEDGRIIETGTHSELLASGEKYATLYETQVEA